MQQRVQIARALALKPASDADGRAVRRARRHDQGEPAGRSAESAQRTGTSFVFITHDIEEAVYLGDRVIVLAGPPGRIHNTVEIALPRPRDQMRTRQSPEFLHYRAAIHAAVLGAGGH